MMVTNFAEMVAEYDDVLLPRECKKIIDKFEYDNRKSKGITSEESGNDNTGIKKSTDLWISQWEDWKEEDDMFFKALNPYVKKYLQFIKERLGDQVQCTKSELVDSGYQIQRTQEGELYDWHADDDVSPILDTIVFPLRGYRDSGTVMSARRLFTYMFYLNDDFGGGFTQFRVGPKDSILNVAPKQGKLICFPASWYWHHRGDVVTEGSKYVCTGWLSDHVTTFSNDSCSLSPEYRKDARSAGRKMLLQFNENTGRIEMDDDMKKENAKSDTFRGMYPKLSDLDTITDQTMQGRGV